MANGDEKSEDLYAVLGLNKECTASELRSAYKKLALRWHPDRCSVSGTSEEAKTKFQEIQQAYSVLSDENKRFLYDIGAYDNDDDENGMGDFMSEMAVLMSQTKSNWIENESRKREILICFLMDQKGTDGPSLEMGQWSFEELQETFDDMFPREIKTPFVGSEMVDPTTSSSSCEGYYETSTSSKKRDFAVMNSGKKEGPTGLIYTLKIFVQRRTDYDGTSLDRHWPLTIIERISQCQMKRSQDVEKGKEVSSGGMKT